MKRLYLNAQRLHLLATAGVITFSVYRMTSGLAYGCKMKKKKKKTAILLLSVLIIILMCAVCTTVILLSVHVSSTHLYRTFRLASRVYTLFGRPYHRTCNGRTGHLGACRVWCKSVRSSCDHTGRALCMPCGPCGPGATELSTRCPATGYPSTWPLRLRTWNLKTIEITDQNRSAHETTIIVTVRFIVTTLLLICSAVKRAPVILLIIL